MTETKERRDVLLQRVALLEKGYAAGETNLETVLAARDQLLQAELQLITTKEERITIYQKRLDNMCALEKVVKQLFDAKECPQDAMLAATAARLQAEIDLARAGETVPAIEKPLDRKNARAVVEAFVAAMLSGDVETAKSSPGMFIQRENTARNLDRKHLAMKLVYVNDPANPTKAMAISEVVKLKEKPPSGQRDGFLVFTLSMSETGWFVTDIDLESEKSADRELKKFLEANPKSISVPQANPKSIDLPPQTTSDDANSPTELKAPGIMVVARDPAQESKTVDEAVTDAKLPETIQALTASIVTVTRIEPADGGPGDKSVSHAGIVVDPRGYIVIPVLPSQSKSKRFMVRLAEQQEVVGQLAAIDESLKFGVLKIERPQPVAAVSLAKSREARVDDRVILVPSPATKELRRGHVTSTTVVLGEVGSKTVIKTDVTFPLSEYGSLMVSEVGEPLGISMACRADPKPESIVLPLINVLHLITAAIDKPKDVPPLVTVPASPPAIDLHKPVQITLQPVPPLAKSLVELFAPRGAKVLEYEEGKRLKIEAPPHVLEELGKLLELVGRESMDAEAKPTDSPAQSPKPTEKPNAENPTR